MQPIRKEVIVEASQETAFKVFTERMDLWWPRTHHVGKTPAIETALEPGFRGRWFTRHEDGSEVNIGYVLVYDPYARLVLVWQIDGNFQCDPQLHSEIEVTFRAEGPLQTKVNMEHRDLEKLAGGTKVIEDMNDGWGYIMQLYEEVTNRAGAGSSPKSGNREAGKLA
jgi:Activator of Hsp90 ATPase homolog 1-like protein